MSTVRRFLCVLVLVAAPALGQKAPSALEPSRLPPDTLFYLRWGGTSSLGPARNTNSLLRLWADPEFAPVRQALAEAFYSGAKKKEKLQSLTREDIEQVASLFENPFLFGFAGRLDLSRTSGTHEKEAPLEQKPAFFLVYDGAGKTELIARLEEQFDRVRKHPRSITRYAFGPTSVEIITTGEETSYRAVVGPYFVLSDQQRVIEDLITRLRSPERSVASLAGVADYRSARRQTGNDFLVEFLIRIPDLSKLPVPSKEGFDIPAFLRGLRPEKLHATSGSLSLAGEATRVRMAILGDTSPGSVFDLFAESRPTFETLALAPASTTSFSVGQINLSALYQTVRSALLAAFSPKQRTNLELIEALVANQIDMKIPEALDLLRGEVASIATTGDLGPGAQLYAATIQKPTDVLRLVRTIFAKQIAGEEHEGDTTIVKFSFSSVRPPAGGLQPRPYYLAVTPRMLLAAPRVETLREAVKRLAEKDAGALGPLADAAFRRARARFPENLSSLGYLDLTRTPWEKISEAFVEGLKKADEKSAASAAAAKDWMKKISPGLLRRYLHTLASASWKDAGGVYFDAYLE